MPSSTSHVMSDMSDMSKHPSHSPEDGDWSSLHTETSIWKQPPMHTIVNMPTKMATMEKWRMKSDDADDGDDAVGNDHQGQLKLLLSRMLAFYVLLL